MTAAAAPAFSRGFDSAGYAIGFALGGFFDGILLHQILQWHHVLSAVQSPALADLRGQVVADGVFHLVMYLVAVAGLWLLARTRAELAAPAAARRLVANAALGFGAWHALDGVLSHWVLGIHRIRMDVGSPLAWDVGWLVLFGLAPLVFGLLLRRGGGGGAGRSRRLQAGFPIALVSATLAAGAIAGRPVDAADAATTVVLRPGASAGGFLAALRGSDTRILWSDARGAVWVLKPGPDMHPLELYRHGALYVSGTIAPAGCSAWLRPG